MTDKKNSNNSAAEELRLRIEEHERRMAAKPTYDFPPAPVPSRETEGARHACVIAAVRDGRIRMDPTGTLFEIVDERAPRDPLLAKQLAMHLSTIGGKIAAYRAKGIKLVPIPGNLQWRAGDLANILTVVGGSDEAPEEFLQVAKRAVDAWLGVNNAPGWQLVLAGIFQAAAKRDTQDWPERDIEASKWIAETLVRSAPDVPATFRHAAPEHVKKAAKVVSGVRRPGAGKPPTAWALAKRFAEAFGAPMASRRSDATRKRSG